MERKATDKAAVKRAAVRSTRESALLDRRIVPPNHVRSAKVGQFLGARIAQT